MYFYISKEVFKRRCSIEAETFSTAVEYANFPADVVTQNCFGERIDDTVSSVEIDSTGFTLPKAVKSPRFQNNGEIVFSARDHRGDTREHRIRDPKTSQNANMRPEGLQQMTSTSSNSSNAIYYASIQTLQNGSEIFLVVFGQNKEFYILFTVDREIMSILIFFYFFYKSIL